MKGRAGLIAAAAVVAVLMVGGIGVAAWQLWAPAHDGAPEAAVPAESGGWGGGAQDGRGSGGGALPEGVEVLRAKPESEYVKPDGTNVIKRGDYDSDEAYRKARADAAREEVEVPFETDRTQEGRTYQKGEVGIEFAVPCDEAKARGVVAEEGGTWVFSHLAWGSGLAVAWFEGVSGDGIVDVCERLMAHDEVELAYPAYIGGPGDSLATTNDPDLFQQSTCTLSLAGEMRFVVTGVLVGEEEA